MNWKRGLTRIYVVAWAIFTTLCLMIPYAMTQTVKGDRELVADFLREHPGITLQQLQSGEARQIITAEEDRYRKLAQSFGGHDVEDAGRDIDNDLTLAELTVHEDNLTHPWKAYAVAWGWWAALALVLPATIFAILNWIITGFAAQRADMKKAA